LLPAVQTAGVTHAVGFNYRFVPALKLARDIIQAGRLGRTYHVRARYLHDRLAVTGSALWDLGSHIVDLVRFLIGEVATVCSVAASGSAATPGVDDAWAAVVTFANGAIGALEASRRASGRKNNLTLDVNGAKGSLAFDLERLDELEVYLPEEETRHDAHGFHVVSTTKTSHPYMDAWWVPGASAPLRRQGM